MTALDRIISASAASKKYRLSTRHIHRLAAQKSILAKRSGGVWLIDEPSLKRYLSKPHPTGPKPRKKTG